MTVSVSVCRFVGLSVCPSSACCGNDGVITVSCVCCLILQKDNTRTRAIHICGGQTNAGWISNNHPIPSPPSLPHPPPFRYYSTHDGIITVPISGAAISEILPSYCHDGPDDPNTFHDARAVHVPHAIHNPHLPNPHGLSPHVILPHPHGPHAGGGSGEAEAKTKKKKKRRNVFLRGAGILFHRSSDTPSQTPNNTPNHQSQISLRFR